MAALNYKLGKTFAFLPAKQRVPAAPIAPAQLTSRHVPFLPAQTPVSLSSFGLGAL